jgi:hypothetical protein
MVVQPALNQCKARCITLIIWLVQTTSKCTRAQDVFKLFMQIFAEILPLECKILHTSCANYYFACSNENQNVEIHGKKAAKIEIDKQNV